MYKSMMPGLILCLSAGLLLGACGESTGARIEVGQNVRNLCNFSVSGVMDETRCANDTACSMGNEYCWQPDPAAGSPCTSDGDCGTDELCYTGFCYPACDTVADCVAIGSDLGCVANGDGTGNKTCRANGYCRECSEDTQCPMGLVCDNGWCHQSCSTDADCDTSTVCTGEICRQRHVTDFDLSNVGDRDLEIYTDQTVVRGDADAAVFCDIEWSASGTIVVPPGDSAMLRVHFRPPVAGEYRAWIDVISSDSTLSPLPLLLCGQAVETECKVSVDGACPSCASCGEDDFVGYPTKDSVCQ